MLTQYTPTIPSPAQQQKPILGSNFKRSTKNSFTNNNSKRLKAEATSTPINKTNTKVTEISDNTQTNDDDSEFIEVPTKLEQGFEKDDISVKKENYSFDSNTSANISTGDANSQDHGE